MCCRERLHVTVFGKIAGLSLEQAPNCTKILYCEGVSKDSCVARSLVSSDRCSSSIGFVVVISNLQVTIAKHRRTSSSCTLRRCHCIGFLLRFLEGLVDHVVAIGSWLVTLHNTCGRVIVVLQCLSIFFRKTGIETEVNFIVGFCLGLALAVGFPDPMSCSFLVSIDSVTYVSTPFTIVTQETVLSSNRDGI